MLIETENGPLLYSRMLCGVNDNAPIKGYDVITEEDKTMTDARSAAEWKGNRLCIGRKPKIVPDEKYPDVMWRVKRPDGSVSDMVNRTRAKDAALDMLDRDLRAGVSPGDGPPIEQNNSRP